MDKVITARMMGRLTDEETEILMTAQLIAQRDLFCKVTGDMLDVRKMYVVVKEGEGIFAFADSEDLDAAESRLSGMGCEIVHTGPLFRKMG